MTVRWSGAARRDLGRLWDYLKERSPNGGARVVRRIREAADVVGRSPAAGRIGREEGTREFVVTRTPYLLVYEVWGDGPLVLRVLHSAQQWPPLEQ